MKSVNELTTEAVKKMHLRKLKELQDVRDIEMAHAYADEILCKYLRLLGENEIVDEWEKIDKWYA